MEVLEHEKDTRSSSFVFGVIGLNSPFHYFSGSRNRVSKVIRGKIVSGGMVVLLSD
jgi:hypothetical protein